MHVGEEPVLEVPKCMQLDDFENAVGGRHDLDNQGDHLGNGRDGVLHHGGDQLAEDWHKTGRNWSSQQTGKQACAKQQ
eukprot:6032907-Pleurochrysis_carterae.AAC.1